MLPVLILGVGGVAPGPGQRVERCARQVGIADNLLGQVVEAAGVESIIKGIS